MSAEGGHLGWRSGSPDTILKIDHLRTIHAMFALNWLTGFIYESFADRKFKMAAMTRLNFNIGPYEKNV
jgi:hypothetical protein